ncbi:MAG: hypothetical protein ACE5MH_05150 [Terriglobia bacterium]
MGLAVTVRRIKNYSAETGYVYEYYFDSQRQADAGSEYVFIVSRDRKHRCPLRILVRHDARTAWAQRHGRPLTGTEEYAAVKMRLFRAFDEVDDLEQAAATLAVTSANVDALLAALDIP